jgi:phosphoribosylformylglycinamidine synthase PurS subunit
MKWEVTSLLRDGVKGNAQEVIRKALLQLGYNEVQEVLYGSVHTLKLDNKMSENVQREKVEEMCKKQLINTNLYDFNIRLIEE